MTRFDAPPSSNVPGAAWRTAGRLVVTRFGLVLAALALTTLAFVAATALAGSVVAVPAALQQAFVSSPLLVYLSPTASRGDAEALRPKLAALPDVAAATLRTREEALAGLIAAGLPAPSDGRNPLPDVWAVTLRAGSWSTTGFTTEFTTRAVTARDAIRALPSVEAVRFDEAWAGALDRAASGWSRIGRPSVAGGLVVAAVALFCVHLLFGRGLASEASTAPTTVAPLSIVSAAVVVLSAVIAYVSCRLCVAVLGSTGWPTMQPMAVAVGQKLVTTVIEVALAGSLLVVGGLAASRVR